MQLYPIGVTEIATPGAHIMNRRKKMKSVYVVKNSPPDIDEKHKELETKSVYLLKADDQVVNRYSDIVYDFIEDQDGLFLLISDDRNFYNNFRKSFYKEFQIDQERIRLAPNLQRAHKEIRLYREHKKTPLLFLERTMNDISTLHFLEEIKAEFKDILVIVLMNDSDEKKVAQCVEAGADNFITKPISVNMLIEKIANTLVPQDDIGKLVREGKNRLAKVEFALAYGVARDILEKKPGSPAGLLIMGDALKGLTKRKEAIKLFIQASENAPMYLEPLKKIVAFHKEDEDMETVLKYLIRMDELSPLHPGRKAEIGDLYFERNEYKHAAKFYFEAVKLTHEQRKPQCVQMAEEYANMIFEKEEGSAEGLLTLLTRLAKAYKVEAHWAWYNRLGMLLRRRKCWQEAIKAYSEASLRNPKDGSILFNLGMAYVEGQLMDSAADQFEQILRVDRSLYEDNIDAAYIMGQVFIRAKRITSAATVLNHVNTVKPGYKKVKSLLKSLEK